MRSVDAAVLVAVLLALGFAFGFMAGRAAEQAMAPDAPVMVECPPYSRDPYAVVCLPG